MAKGVIFCFNRTIFDPGARGLTEECKKLLEDLKTRGYKLCLFGRTSDNRIKLICRLRLFELFEKILFALDDRIKEHFRDCLVDMDLEANEVFVVGTRVGREITVGKRMGMKTILFRSGRLISRLPVNQSHAADFITFDIRDLINFLE